MRRADQHFEAPLLQCGQRIAEGTRERGKRELRGWRWAVCEGWGVPRPAPGLQAGGGLPPRLGTPQVGGAGEVWAEVSVESVRLALGSGLSGRWRPGWRLCLCGTCRGMRVP